MEDLPLRGSISAPAWSNLGSSRAEAAALGPQSKMMMMMIT